MKEGGAGVLVPLTPSKGKLLTERQSEKVGGGLLKSGSQRERVKLGESRTKRHR